MTTAAAVAAVLRRYGSTHPRLQIIVAADRARAYIIE